MARTQVTPVSISGDRGQEAAVIATIQNETQAFVDSEFEDWATCWVQDERAKTVCVSAIGQSVISGWEDIASHMRQALVEQDWCGMIQFRQSNFQINIDNQIAWATFDQWAKDNDGASWESFETRILERQGGHWKIVYLSFLEQHYDRIAKDGFCVDKKGHIVWASPETLETLKNHPYLVVSAGRIRARQTQWDRTLQDAIARASRYHSFFELWRFTQETGGPFHYPIVLGESDEGG